jgi:hypothetical protein
VRHDVGEVQPAVADEAYEPCNVGGDVARAVAGAEDRLLRQELVVGPFSALIRRRWLRALSR